MSQADTQRPNQQSISNAIISTRRTTTMRLRLASCLLASLCAFILIVSQQPAQRNRVRAQQQPVVEVDKEGAPIPCIDNGKFYRNPTVSNTRQDCGKYYQCYDNKVISFRCNSDLYFDVDRQICDFKLKVFNCDKSHGECLIISLF